MGRQRLLAEKVTVPQRARGLSGARLRQLRLLLLVAVPLLVLVAGGLIWQRGGGVVSTDDAYVKADIASVAPEVAGRVLAVAVHDHARVKTGDVLVRLDAEPFELVLSKAEAELDNARMQVETARAIWRETQSELGEVENRAAYLARQAARQVDLARHGVAAATKLEEAESDAAVAADRVTVVRQRLARVLTALSGNPELLTEDHPMVRQKRADRDRAALDLQHATIVAPIDGTVANLTLQPGEQVKPATPLFVIVSAARPWVEANVKETALTHITVGQPARVVLDAYPDEVWQGEVASISPATGAEFAILPPQNASGNWVKVVQRLPVKVRLLPHEGEAPLRAGTTATVDIDTGRRRALVDLLPDFLVFNRASARAAER